jgi:hypothetical protein
LALFLLTSIAASAQEVQRWSCVNTWYWTAEADARSRIDNCDYTGALFATQTENLAGSSGMVFAEAAAPQHAFHKVNARSRAYRDVALASATAWTNEVDVLRFERNDPRYSPTGTVTICYIIHGRTYFEGDGILTLVFQSVMGDKELVYLNETYTSGTSIIRQVCGSAPYTIGELIGYSEILQVGTDAHPGGSRGVEVKGHAEGDFMNTARMISITPSEGHYLAYTESGATYPPALPLAVSVNQGTIGTELTIEGSGFGDKKGKVLIGGAALKIAKGGWSDSSITGTVKKVLPVGPYTITIAPKGEPSFNYTDTFTMSSPITSTVTPEHAVVGTEVQVEGSFFGVKKGKVYLEDGNGKQYKCKVSEWYMDPPKGASRLKFIVPPKLASGSYTLGITNKVGAIISPFTVDPPQP